jgi:hypothetical protein
LLNDAIGASTAGSTGKLATGGNADDVIDGVPIASGVAGVEAGFETGATGAEMSTFGSPGIPSVESKSSGADSMDAGAVSLSVSDSTGSAFAGSARFG